MRLLVSIFSILIVGFSFGQKADDTVNVQTFNSDLLDSLIFEQVNQVRLDSNLAKLFYSDSLDAEASQHSKFMAQQRSISYSEDGKKAGECNSKIFYRDWTKKSYKELAKSIVEQWLDSEGHAKLLLGDFFLYGGCGVAYMEWKSISEMYVYTCFRISYWE